MNIALFVATLLLLDRAWRIYKNRCESRARWGLYALRDKLRDDAYENPAILETPLFRATDYALTVLASTLAREMTVWRVMGSMLSKSSAGGDTSSEPSDLSRHMGESPFADYYRGIHDKFAETLRVFLQRRHPVAFWTFTLFVLLGPDGRHAMDPVVEEFMNEAGAPRLNGNSLAPCP